MENDNKEVSTYSRNEIRARFLKLGPNRYNLLAYAFVRGRTHERCERRVSEHNLPSARCLQVAVNRLLDNDEALKPVWEQKTTPEVKAWLTIPEERIKRFGPRVPKIRKSDRKNEAAE